MELSDNPGWVFTVTLKDLLKRYDAVLESDSVDEIMFNGEWIEKSRHG